MSATLPGIDASRLPRLRLDHRALVWWAILLMIAIEGTMFLLAFAAHFYLGAHSASWPPKPWPRPLLLIPTINLGVLILSGVPNWFMDKAAEREDRSAVVVAMAFELLLAFVAIALRGVEFAGLPWKWNTHAFASSVWVILGFHTSHLVASTVETAIMFFLALRRGLSKKHFLDIRVDGLYWYFVIASAFAVWLVCDVTPRL